MKETEVVKQLRINASRYRRGCGDGLDEELDYQWSDMSRRHVYDLCRMLELAADTIELMVINNEKTG